MTQKNLEKETYQISDDNDEENQFDEKCQWQLLQPWLSQQNQDLEQQYFSTICGT